MVSGTPVLPSWLVLDSILQNWLLEDLGRGDRTTQCLLSGQVRIGRAEWIAKEAGIIAGLPIAARVFQMMSQQVRFVPIVAEGTWCEKRDVIARIHGPADALLMGERVALNIVMHLSGIASLTRQYVDKIGDLPVKLVDTRKTRPGLRLLEKYASQVGGAVNHRMGLDDAVMIKDNHIQAAGGIGNAIARIRAQMPFPLTIEVETENINQIKEALEHGADIIMLDNMPVEMMYQAVEIIRQCNNRIKIEASGNITLENIRAVAETGIDYISTSAPITRSTWLDVSMKLDMNTMS
ncbi:nicotinate-nucleotide diphosphorylase (carboxylating) [[Phormidium ambiguum] IAM M-71]|uniref:Probable nicotinate-nucleotide pyrophosphorylase [carboxylating] n=1 Tax=[Phormidium ambiguum] IAM M-71 TaxID=454136 RepID=A0A1U7IB84_9CYAN|nr:carboxylating nicotinate-nucleotide diphosphorylase [Phormidium ambiguum]OKH33907.1 nicotinate-nucleotide diphosphorylase (carboxylating) [Phormidium ambiguum IAM M-71]